MVVIILLLGSLVLILLLLLFFELYQVFHIRDPEVLDRLRPKIELREAIELQVNLLAKLLSQVLKVLFGLYENVYLLAEVVDKVLLVDEFSSYFPDGLCEFPQVFLGLELA